MRRCLTIDQFQDSDGDRTAMQNELKSPSSRMRFFCYFAIFFWGGGLSLCRLLTCGNWHETGAALAPASPCAPIDNMNTIANIFRPGVGRRTIHNCVKRFVALLLMIFLSIFIYSPMVFFVSASLLGLSLEREISHCQAIVSISN